MRTEYVRFKAAMHLSLAILLGVNISKLILDIVLSNGNPLYEQFQGTTVDEEFKCRKF